MKGTQLRAYEGNKGMKATLVLLITAFAETNDVLLKPNQLVNLTNDLEEVMSHESLEDISLMFKLARQGKLEMPTFAKKKSLYLTITQDIIPAYMEFKTKEREKIHYEDKKKHQSSILDSIEENMKDPAFKNNEEWKENLRRLRLSLTPPNRQKTNSPLLSDKLGSDTSDSNYDLFRTELSNKIKTWDKEHLIERIEAWTLLRTEGRYVDILENELKTRK